MVQTRKASRYVKVRYIQGARATIKHLVGMHRDSAHVGRASSTDERQIQHGPQSEASHCISEHSGDERPGTRSEQVFTYCMSLLSEGL